MRVLIAAESASARFGGEAFLPLNYFRFLRARGVDVRLVTHDRTESELSALLPNEIGRIQFVKDTWLHRILWRLGSILPQQFAQHTLGLASHLFTQWIQRRMVIETVKRHRIDV